MDETKMVSQQVLTGIGNDIVSALARALGSHFKSGDLLNSISYKIENGKLNIYMLPHWKYVEYGTPGTLEGKSSTVGGDTVSFGPSPNRKMPVKKVGDKWVNMITDQVGDFALAKHIQLYGTKPYPFLRPVIYHQLKDIVKRNVMRASA
jgi:hypothetical protein